MKKIKASAALLILSVLLTGCKESDKPPVPESVDDRAVVNSSVVFSDTNSSASTPTLISTYSTSEPSANEPFQRAELDRMLSVLDEYAYYMRGLHPYWDVSEQSFTYIPDGVDITQFVTEDNLNKFGTYSTDYYYKVVSGDYSTAYDFDSKLDEIFTESFKRRCLGYKYDYFRFILGEIYVARNYNPSCPPNKYSMTLTTERVDDDTVVLVFTNNNTVGGDHDPDTITLIMCRDGKYRIDDENRVYSHIPDYFAFDSDLEIIYGDITISHPSTWDPTTTSQTP